MARIQCPHCGAPVATEHINIQKLVAACPQCDQVFSIEPFFNTEQPSGLHEKTKRPLDLNIETSEDQFQASYLWRKGNLGTQVGLTALWGFVAGFTGLALISLMFFESGAVLGLFLGIPGLLLGIYLWLVVLLNRITVTITSDRIAVRTEPIYKPFVNRGLPRSQVAQVKVVNTDLGQDPDLDQYTLYAYSPDGTRRALISGLRRSYAQYLVQHVTTYLNPAEAIEGLNTDTSDALVMGDDGELIPAEEARRTNTKNGALR